MTRSGDISVLNRLHVISPDIYHTNWLIVHGLHRLFSSQKSQELDGDSSFDLDGNGGDDQNSSESLPEHERFWKPSLQMKIPRFYCKPNVSGEEDSSQPIYFIFIGDRINPHDPMSKMNFMKQKIKISHTHMYSSIVVIDFVVISIYEYSVS